MRLVWLPLLIHNAILWNILQDEIREEVVCEQLFDKYRCS